MSDVVTAVRDVRDASALDSLGWRMSLRTFRAAQTSASVLLLCAGGLGAACVSDWAARAAPQDGRALTLSAAVLTCVYCLAVHALREIFTVRRIRLVNHPFSDFFRALDIPRATVVIVEVAPRLVRLGCVCCGVSWGSLPRAWGYATTAEVLATSVAPLVTLLGMLTCTVSVAAWSRNGRPARAWAAVLAGGGCGILVAGTLHWVIALVTRGGVPSGREMDLADAAGASVGPLVVASIAFAVTATVGLRRLTSGDPATRPKSLDPRTRPRLAGRLVAYPWIRVVSSDLSPTSRSAAVCRFLLITWMLGTAAVLLPTEDRVLVSAIADNAAVSRACCVIALVVGLTLSELLCEWIGPSTLALRWRAQWEAGADVWPLALGPLLVALGPITLVGVPLALGMESLGGNGVLPLCVLWSALASAWTVTAIMPSGPSSADGTASTTLSSALLCVVGSVAMMVTMLTAAEAHAAWAALPMSALALGGASWAAKRRVLSLPSRPLA